MTAFSAFAELPIATAPLGGDPADEAWREFLFNAAVRPRLVVELSAARLAGQIATLPGGDPWCSLAHTTAPGSPYVLGQTTFLFGDGPWFGRPSDSLRPNEMVDARIVSSADIDRSIPLSPEATRRGEVAVGEILLANADGGLDETVARYSVGGRTVRIRFGPARGDYASFALIQEAFASSWESTHETIRLRLQSTAAFLQTPLQSRTYTGTGPVDGDATLIGRRRPSLWGECFNVTPVLINRDQWIYQVHDGPIYAIDAVKERGLPLDFQEDVASFTDLRLTTVEAGSYATCLATGCLKIGFGVAGPAGPVTLDVRGDAASGGYTDTTGEILLRMAVARARIDGGLLDRNSFTALPKGRVGYYDDGSEQTSVADAFDAMLRAVLAYYGTTRDAALTANAPRAPTELRARRLDLDRHTILDLEDIGIEQPPRWAQAATYAKNWTPIPEDQLSDALSSDARERLALPYYTARRIAGEVQQRDRSAIEGATIDTFFTEFEAADAVCQGALELFRESRRRFRVSLPRIGYIVDLGDIVRITYPRFGFQDGRNMLVVGVRDNGGRGVIELTVWG